MSKRGMRKESRKKLDKIMAAAKKKEGNPITEKWISRAAFESFYKRASFKGIRECVLSDGRYICEFWDGETKTYHYHIIDNLDADVLEGIVVFGIREEGICEENKKDWLDGRYQQYLQKKERCESMEEADALVNPVSRTLADRYFSDDEGETINYYSDKPYNIVLKRMGLWTKRDRDYNGLDYPVVDLDSLPRNPRVDFRDDGTPGDKTRFMMKRIITSWYQSMDTKNQEYFYLLFNTNMTQKAIAEKKHVSPQYVSKKKQWFIKKSGDLLRDLGYPVPQKQKSKKKEEKPIEPAATFAENAAGIQAAVAEAESQKEEASAEAV